MVNFEDLINNKEKVCVVGLGYVGLPLATLFAKKINTIGYDIKKERVEELRKNFDKTGEVSTEELKNTKIEFTDNPKRISEAKFIILAIPTPVNKNNIPDLSPVEQATATVGKNISKGSVIVYESTVYPGVTEEICIPILEKESGLKNGVDFKVGYSPERVNPGDNEHTIDKIIKVVSGQDNESLELIALVYGSITTVHKAPSIKVAEAAKVIENTQRDINIALINELSVIFHKLNIETKDVLEAAGTKWNFLRFYPGLVGGHCIGVDPYYLTYKAQEEGYHPEVILSGRRINDNMGQWIVIEVMKELNKIKKRLEDLRVMICGITFKEDVPDIRNSKVFDIYKTFLDYGIKPEVIDPIANSNDVFKEYGIELSDLKKAKDVDVVIVAVSHSEYKRFSLEEWKKRMSEHKPLLVDIKNIYSRREAKDLGLEYWCL